MTVEKRNVIRWPVSLIGPRTRINECGPEHDGSVRFSRCQRSLGDDLRKQRPNLARLARTPGVARVTLPFKVVAPGEVPAEVVAPAAAGRQS